MAGVVTTALWYEALASPHGIVVKTNDIDNFKQQMYRLRDQAHDPELYSMSIATSPTNPTEEVWLVKRGVKK